MTMFMPELGIAWADPKPERLCQFPECPYKSKGYDGHKMKICSKCQDVRYCSKDCQRSDWKSHGLQCRVPTNLIPSDWIHKYEGWAVIEALRLHTNYMPAKGKGLEVILFEGAAIGPNLPEFLIASCKVCDLGKVIPGYQADHDPTVSLSREFRKTGGIGAVTVVFSFWKNAESPGSAIREDFHFREPRKGNYKYMPREQCKDMVKATCNGRTSLDQIERNIHSLSTGGCSREGDVGWGLLQEIKTLKLASEDKTSILADPDVISMMDDLLETLKSKV
ncbi:hypothetical protein EDD85DRAFT_870542 [Armillaria nabsnona]|nr:hypothetical protein EDD85DRAFT_870542 [Armillaria nabsnona]